VLLFVGDDVPEGQYTPEIVRAIAPAGMAAELVLAPYFAQPSDSLRTTVLHHIMAGGKYPGAGLTSGCSASPLQVASSRVSSQGLGSDRGFQPVPAPRRSLRRELADKGAACQHGAARVLEYWVRVGASQR